MIVTEFYMKRRDGVVLNRTYSDENYYIERDGVKYEEAVDPEGTGRVYIETDEKIPGREEEGAEEPVETND
jgi:hypothetical protein